MSCLGSPITTYQVGNQPHSEVAALAITMSEWFKSVALESRFSNPENQGFALESGKSIFDRKKGTL